jgi:hypothetical protein
VILLQQPLNCRNACGRDHLVDLIFAQLIKKYPISYGTGWAITVITTSTVLCSGSHKSSPYPVSKSHSNVVPSGKLTRRSTRTAFHNYICECIELSVSCVLLAPPTESLLIWFTLLIYGEEPHFVVICSLLLFHRFIHKWSQSPSPTLDSCQGDRTSWKFADAHGDYKWCEKLYKFIGEKLIATKN